MQLKMLAAALALAAFLGPGIGLAMAADEPPAAAEGGAEQGEDKGFFGKLKDDIVEGAQSVGEGAAAAVPDVPSGAVVAFNRDACPLGWSPFPPAEGRVIRGTGNTGGDRTVSRMQIGEASKADDGDDVPASLPWLGLLYCEKD
ncbi:MAG: hypothetical protein AB7P52_12800 [Alphaproteobacteria bacterium]